MAEFILICVAAVLASLLTFFSGFGLGTILMPVMAIFFPIEVAISLTGVVHLLNNLFKFALVGKHTSWRIAAEFGIPAFIAAFAGSYILVEMTDLPSLATFSLGGNLFKITPLNLVIALLLIFFALMEIVPALQNIGVAENRLVVGGLLSGFFGGLSGHQGALRSAFLIRLGLSKETFIATGVVIACIIDISRLGVYGTQFFEAVLVRNPVVVIAATLSAFFGAFLGSKLLAKVTLAAVQKIVMLLLILLAIWIGLGWQGHS